MSTVADWDADVEALVISTVDGVTVAPDRYASDLRRGRIGTYESGSIQQGEYKFQIIHTPQGESSAQDSGASYAVVQTQINLYHRLGEKLLNKQVVKEEERDYTIGIIPKILFDLMRDAVWNALGSLHRIVERPVATQPEAVSRKVIGFSVALTVELAP